jgi:hypothetical protein
VSVGLTWHDFKVAFVTGIAVTIIILGSLKEFREFTWFLLSEIVPEIARSLWKHHKFPWNVGDATEDGGLDPEAKP